MSYDDDEYSRRQAEEQRRDQDRRDQERREQEQREQVRRDQERATANEAQRQAAEEARREESRRFAEDSARRDAEWREKREADYRESQRKEEEAYKRQNNFIKGDTKFPASLQEEWTAEYQLAKSFREDREKALKQEPPEKNPSRSSSSSYNSGSISSSGNTNKKSEFTELDYHIQQLIDLEETNKTLGNKLIWSGLGRLLHIATLFIVPHLARHNIRTRFARRNQLMFLKWIDTAKKIRAAQEKYGIKNRKGIGLSLDGYGKVGSEEKILVEYTIKELINEIKSHEKKLKVPRAERFQFRHSISRMRLRFTWIRGKTFATWRREVLSDVIN